MKVKKSYRLEEETVARVEEYAQQHGLTNTDAVEGLILKGLNAATSTTADEDITDVDTSALLLPMLKEQIVELKADKEELRQQLRMQSETHARQMQDMQQITINAQHLQHEQSGGFFASLKRKLLPKADAMPQPAAPEEPIVEE